jgi:tRNA pseudouridine13 synthase
VSLPRAYGEPVLAGNIRTTPEDFIVEELPAFEPAGAGEHLLLTIEKRGLTTPNVARRLAQWAGVPEMDVGYAGLKDRNAVTRQRFTVRIPKKVAPDLAALALASEAESLRVLDSHWHARKLPRGALAGNRFELLVRDVQGDRLAIEARVAAIATGGLPNYFGQQRFGRDGDNVETARKLFAGARLRRDQRSIVLSAARSEVFNQVLAARVAGGSWATGLDGEVWMLEGGHSVFGPEPLTDELVARVRELDVHPTGPLWGQGALRSGGEAERIEREVAAGHADLCAGLEKEGLRQERRALRVKASGLSLEWVAEDAVRLAFSLPPGSYATALLAELGEALAP